MDLKEIESKLRGTTLPMVVSSPKAGVVYLAPKGQLDMASTHYLQDASKDVLDSGYINVILDLGGINYAASTGIGTVTHMLKEIMSKQGKLIVINIQPKVLDVFKLLGFTSFLNIMDSLDDAIKAI